MKALPGRMSKMAHVKALPDWMSKMAHVKALPGKMFKMAHSHGHGQCCLWLGASARLVDWSTYV